ncbi:MAG TPA: 4Fe-4S ferredoxin [Coriobacteriia bacterium]|nr:4Fe-4S ferredoxin [Coriobacteriia bacterium]
MGSFHLTKMSLRNLGKPATKMYPVKPANYTSRSKGSLVNDIDTCILCSICAKKCPTYAIAVDKVAKDSGSWSFDSFSCIQCLSCVRACPKNCLSMNPQHPAAATEKGIVSIDKMAVADGEA